MGFAKEVLDKEPGEACHDHALGCSQAGSLEAQGAISCP